MRAIDITAPDPDCAHEWKLQSGNEYVCQRCGMLGSMGEDDPIKLGVCRDAAGTLRVGLEITNGKSRVAICLTEPATREIAKSFVVAADKLKELIAKEVS